MREQLALDLSRCGAHRGDVQCERSNRDGWHTGVGADAKTCRWWQTGAPAALVALAEQLEAFGLHCAVGGDGQAPTLDVWVPPAQSDADLVLTLRVVERPARRDWIPVVLGRVA